MTVGILDGQDSNEIFSGDTRIWGVLSDMLSIKEMSIGTVSDKFMRFTPDGIPEIPFDPDDPPESEADIDTGSLGERIIPRVTRAGINLDKAYVIQHYLEPTRPQKFGRDTEYNARSGMAGDAGMNPSEMGAIGKFTDIFRVSIAKNTPIPPTVTGTGGSSVDDDAALAEAYESRSSYNDLFGAFPGRKDLLYGRFEIRITAHFYKSDQRTGPLFFSGFSWPRDSDEDGETVFPRGIDRPVELDQLKVESTAKLTETTIEATEFEEEKIETTKKTRMSGQILTGAFAFNRTHHAWGILVSLPAIDNCNILNEDLIAATFEEDPTVKDIFIDPKDSPTPFEEHDAGVTIDERIKVFSEPKCPDIETLGFDTICETSLLTSYLPCEEVSSQSYNNRWITITDRFNSLLNEIDHLYCIVKALDFKIEKLAVLTEDHITATSSIIAWLLENIPKLEPKDPAFPPIMFPLISIDLDLELLKTEIPLPDVCKDEPPPVLPPPSAPPPAEPAPPPPPIPPP